MKKILNILLGLLFVGLSAQTTTVPSGVSTTENYVYSRTYLEAVTTSSTTAKQVQSIQYFDGLGRPKQSIAIKASPLGRDVVTPVVYDVFGRQTRDYLPIPQSSTTNGTIYTQSTGLVNYPVSDPTNIYLSEKIYSEKVLESSPLDRVLQQVQPGNNWSSNPIKFDYEANTATEVLKFVTTTIWANNATSSDLKLDAINKFYQANQLYKNKVTDEDGNVSYEFKNGEGQTLLVRKMLNATDGVDTYYVYNEYNQLAYVIPPLAVSKFKNLSGGTNLSSLNSIDINHLCYQYRYDTQSRLVEKKLPGKGWEYMVYDKQDRLVATQDALLGTTQNNFGSIGWLFTKYDQFGRVVYTGFTANTSDRSSLQTSIDNSSNTQNNESRTSSVSFTQNGLGVYYTKSAFPTTITAILSVNYYDDYPAGTPTRPTSIYGYTTLPSASYPTRSLKGLPTASFVKNIENDGWTKNYTWYDDKIRVIGTESTNFLGGATTTQRNLDFAGTVLNLNTYHRRLSSSVQKVIRETFTYDHQNRLLQHKHKVDSNVEELLSNNQYNELGQLTTKKVGGLTTGTTPFQTVDYQYNIRGWMTQINNPTALGTDLFGYQIKYQNPDTTKSSPTAKYNGNISQINWSTATDGGIKRTYTYQYDALNRLTGSRLWDQMNLDRGEFQENLTYDLNGNISTLKRKGIWNGTTPLNMDDLKYNYENGDYSNKLSYLKEQGTGNALSGYPLSPGQTGQVIAYDVNGNMTNHLDKNISSITYNYLNLPKQITQSGGNINYVYRVDGLKVKKTYGGKETDYLDGFQYETVNSITTLQFVPTAEGYYDFTKNLYIYNYNDHLGNVRLSYADSNKNGAIEASTEIIEENNYYPFGLKHEGYNSLAGNQSYQYKYNGKELQTETGMYDYGARFYMPDIGRWGVIDQRSQYTHEAYSYVWNNPINFADPTGMTGEAVADCPTCPKTPTYQPFIDDPNNTYVYDPNTGKVEKEIQIQEVVLTGKAKESNDSGPGSLALSALLVSQADSPAPGPADVVAAGMLIYAGVWWSYNQFNQPSHTTIADPSAGMGSYNAEAEEDTDVNGQTVPQDSTSVNRKGGGKNGQHANLKAKQSAGEKYEEAKSKLDSISRKPNKTKEDNKLKTQLEKQVKHWKAKAQETGENHSRNAKGNR